MKIEIDKFYRTRDGRKAYVYRQHTLDTNLFDGVMVNGDCAMIWGSNGNYYKDKKESLFDLVAPWTEKPLTLEVGKRYRTRDGRIAFVSLTYQNSDGKRMFQGVVCSEGKLINDSTCLWFNNGKSAEFVPDDLVECLDED